MDARAGAWLGAVRAGDGDQAEGVAGRQWRDRRTGISRSGATPIRCGRAAPGSMLAAQHMAQPFAVPAPKPLPLPEGGGDRNAIPIYTFPNAHVVHHFIPAMPLRISAMRALGAYHNVFSIESFMDELADRGRRRSGRIPPEASGGSARPRRHRQGRARLRLAERPEGAAGPRLRLCLCALQESGGLLRHRHRGRSRTARPGVRGWCARWRRSTAARWSIPTA